MILKIGWGGGKERWYGAKTAGGRKVGLTENRRHDADAGVRLWLVWTSDAEFGDWR